MLTRKRLSECWPNRNCTGRRWFHEASIHSSVWVQADDSIVSLTSLSSIVRLEEKREKKQISSFSIFETNSKLRIIMIIFHVNRNQL